MDIYGYIESLVARNRITRDGYYKFCRVTGVENMVELVQQMRRADAFVCIDDVNDGQIYTRGQFNGYFKQKVYTVFVLKKYKVGNMDSMASALAETRLVTEQFLSRMVLDRWQSDDGQYPEVQQVPFREMNQALMDGVTGVMLTLTTHQPIDLSYNEADWDVEA